MLIIHVNKHNIYQNNLFAFINAVSESFTKKMLFSNINISCYHLASSKNKQISAVIPSKICSKQYITQYYNNKKF